MAFHSTCVRRVPATTAVVVLAIASAAALSAATGTDTVQGRARAADGVEIAYTVRGTGTVALVFIHGGLADRTFWKGQLDALSSRFRVVALDLAGHGESGRRAAYTMSAWADDVRAVVDTLHLERVVLVGNSLGGPVALEAAHLLPGRVLGVIGIDTLHDLTQKMDEAASRSRAEAIRSDFAGTCRSMVNELFHPVERKRIPA